MCGIVASVSNRDIVPILIAGLKALEYRGYDSAGLCVNGNGGLSRLRVVGKVANLEAQQAKAQLATQQGIAHTRWATHGVPAEVNAHPIVSKDRVAVVHNGIIENHSELRAELKSAGFTFDSETDTEVIAHLVHFYLDQGDNLEQASLKALKRLHGAYAVAIMDQTNPDQIVGARLGSPLVVGLGFSENFIASDVHALLPVTNRFIYLDEGDVVVIERDAARVVDLDGNVVQREARISELNADAVDLGGYRHFMLKEIYEQPRAVADTLEGRLLLSQGRAILGEQIEGLLDQDTKGIHIVACGTSYHAGLIARHWIESIAEVPCQVEVASEYRYRDPVVPEGTLMITISQSGETADTLAAVRQSQGNANYRGRMVVCNVPESSLVRESEAALMTRAGLEIGVASTKAFTTQLAALALVVLELARARGKDEKLLKSLCDELAGVSSAIERALALDPEIATLSEKFAHRQHALFLGRGVQYPVAMEGSLKLKEISYIHAEAYPAGELKHGPLALVDEDMPVIAVAPSDDLLEKLKSNISEVRARGGQMFVVADHASAEDLEGDGIHVITVADNVDFTAPILMTIPLQLLAYHVAILKGTDVDKPRNLAKSVTVE